MWNPLNIFFLSAEFNAQYLMWLASQTDTMELHHQKIVLSLEAFQDTLELPFRLTVKLALFPYFHPSSYVQICIEI